MVDKNVSLQSEEAVPPVNSGPGEATVGSILKNARQSQNLDYLHLGEITKLRPNVLESLENEEWERLSAPIFVKSFLRTYAKALGLNEEDIVRRYEREEPVGDPVPRPLSSLSPMKKRVSAVFIIPVLVLVIGFAVFSWRQYGLQSVTKQRLNAMTPAVKHMTAAPKRAEQHETAPVKKEENHKKIATSWNASRKKADVEQSAVSTSQTTIPEKAKKKGVISEAGVPGNRKLQTPILAKKGERSAPMKTSPAPISHALTLKGDVTERTWMKVSVDGKDPKEYIFRPGSHPVWEADKGFEIVIGNAAGIALEINGRKLDNLGGHGKVVHLKLP